MAFFAGNATQPFKFQERFPCENNAAEGIIYSVLAVSNVMLSLPSNTWVMWLLCNGKGASWASDIFVFNLSAMELLSCATVLCSLVQIFNLGSPSVLAALYFFYGFVHFGRPIFQCCVCVERYLAVVHPIIYLKYKSLKYRLASVATMWMFTFVICTTQIIVKSDYIVTGIFLSVLTVDSFCSCSILRVLRHPCPGEGERGDMNVVKKRAFTTVFVLQIFTILNYLPMIVLMSVGWIFSFTLIYCHVIPVVFAFAIFGSFVHPFLYLSREGIQLCGKGSHSCC